MMPASPTESSAGSPAAQSGGGSGTGAVRVCQVPGCQAELGRGFYFKYRVCESHSRVPSIELDGVQQRFCQQCSKFHVLEVFDGLRHSCRASLQRHQQRRQDRRMQQAQGAQQPPPKRKRGTAANGQDDCEEEEGGEAQRRRAPSGKRQGSSQGRRRTAQQVLPDKSGGKKQRPPKPAAAKVQPVPAHTPAQVARQPMVAAQQAQQAGQLAAGSPQGPTSPLPEARPPEPMPLLAAASRGQRAATGSAAAGGKWSGRRKVTVAALLLLVVAAAVGTGVGVSQATKSSSSSSSDGSANVSGEPAEQPQALSPPSPPPPAPVVLLSPSPFVSPSPPPPSPLLAASPPPVLSPPPPVNSPPPPPPVNSPPPPPVLSPPVVSPPPPPPPGTSPPPPPAATPPPAAPGPAWLPAGGVALLEDGFSGNSLDAFVWDYETDPPVQGRDANQLQTYTSSLDNIAVVDDILYIKAQKLPDGTYTSGRLNSRPNGGWYPGGALPDGRTAASVHVEASIQVPTAGQGLWPQFWLAPLEDAYGAWPASGEIDVMQARNNMSSVTQAIQFGSPWPANSKAEVTTADVAPFLGDFHTYAVDWTVDTIIMYVDGRETARFVPRATDPANGWYSAGNAATQAPFDKPFSVVLNLAVGGTWPGPPDGTTPFPAQMAVQYVHAWAVPQ